MGTSTLEVTETVIDHKRVQSKRKRNSKSKIKNRGLSKRKRKCKFYEE